MKVVIACVAIVASCLGFNELDACADPFAFPGGEISRIDITRTGMNSNLSGATWNPLSRKLWLVANNGSVWRMSCSGTCQTASEWHIDSSSGTPFQFSIGGDTEAITQIQSAAAMQNTLFIGVEQYRIGNDANYRLIRRYEVTGSVPPSINLTGEWNLLEMKLGEPNDGLESLTFVPDDFLLHAGFVDRNGANYSGSQYGTGGLFFAGLQRNGADIYVFDLDLNHPGQYRFVGQYDVGQSEMADMYFDISDGRLYSYSNYGDSGGNGSADILQALALSPIGAGPIKALPVTASWYGPRIHNNEGIALVPNSQCNSNTTRNFFLTTDDGGDSNSLGIYPGFPVTGIVDSDSDGVADCVDLCPNTAPGAAVDTTGCSPTSPPPTPTFTATATPTATSTATPTPTATSTPTVSPATPPPLPPTATATPYFPSDQCLSALKSGLRTPKVTVTRGQILVEAQRPLPKGGLYKVIISGGGGVLTQYFDRPAGRIKKLKRGLYRLRYSLTCANSSSRPSGSVSIRVN